MNAQLVLGCHGSRRYGFSMCRGTQNPIADLRKLGTDSETILDHLDNHYKIFDKVLEDLNQINNIINFLTKYSIVPEHLHKLIQAYLTMHRGCGLYMYIESFKNGETNV